MLIDKEKQLCLKIFNSEPYDYLLPLVDWDKVYQLLCSQRLFEYGYRLINKYIPDTNKKKLKMEYIVRTLKRKQYINEVKKIANKLYDNKIRFILVKGLSFSNYIYQDIYMRETSDIDLLVYEKDILKIDGLLREIKYIPIRNGITFTSPVYKGYKPPNNLEVFDYILQEENLNFSVEIQRFIHGVFKNEYIADFFEDTDRLDIDGCLIEILSLENNFIHLITNTYINSHVVNAPILKTAHLRDYVDIKEFFARYLKILNWDYIIKKVRKYGIENTFLIVLNEVNEVFGNTIPMNIIDRFYNERSNHWYENVAIPVWKSSIIDMMFNPSKNESSEIIFEKSYSTINPNYNLPVNVINNCACFNFIDEKYGKERFKYSIHSYENVLTLTLKLTDREFFNSFDISIIFLVRDKINGIHETHFTVFFDKAFKCLYKKQEVFSHIIIEELRNEVVKVSDSDIQLQIPYDFISDDLTRSGDRKLSYKIQLRENIQGLIKQSIDELGYKEYAPKVIRC